MKKQFLLGLMAMLLPLTSWAADEFTVTLSKTSTTYAGDNTPQPVISSVTEDESPVTEYQTTYSLNGKSVNEIRDAGTYTVTVTKDEKTGTAEYTVEKAELTLTVRNTSKVYGQSDDDLTPNYGADYQPGDSKNNVIIAGLKVKRISGYEDENVGSYTITLNAEKATTDNYTLEVTGQASLNITEKPLSVTFTGLDENWTYGEAEKKLEEITVTGSDYAFEDTDKTVGLTWTVDNNATVKNAATYGITASVTSKNYTIVNPTATITIDKAPLTITVDDVTKTYGEKDKPFAAASVSGAQYGETVAVTLSRSDDGEDVTEDGYEIDECEIDTENSAENAANNYEIVYEEVATLTIEPKSLADEEKPISVAFSGDKTYQGKNYELADGVITVTYNDKETDQNKDLSQTTDYTIEVSETRNVGETVTVTIKAVDGGNYKDETQISFEIAKAPLTLAVATQTITFDANQDAIDQIEKTVSDSYITATGLVGDDQLTDLGIEFSLNPEVTVTIGDNEECIVIKAESEIAENYDIEYKYGTLTVGTGAEKNNSITIGRDYANTHELLRAYNGYKTFNEEGQYVVPGGFTVTIKEDRTIKAKQWYSMVLPFDISVRDFSRMMGYAVVDVPSYTPSSTGDPSFVLHFDVIKANTLFLFKTDNDVNMSKGLTFELQRSGNNKIGDGLVVIDYQPEYAFEDAAGNIFQGIYEPKEVSESGYWFVGSGAFVDAGVYFNKWQEAIKLPILTGYVKTAGGENARIFVQEPDGSTTVINAVNTDAATNAEGWYTIGGVKLEGQPTQPGVYINNGKKVVIK